MADVAKNIHDVRVLICDEGGSLIAREGDINDVMSAAWENEAVLVAIPVPRLHADFFRLSTRLAGDIIQKLVNHGLRLAIVGDLSRWTDESGALRDFVFECNRGRATWFVADMAELEKRLEARAA